MKNGRVDNITQFKKNANKKSLAEDRKVSVSCTFFSVLKFDDILDRVMIHHLSIGWNGQIRVKKCISFEGRYIRNFLHTTDTWYMYLAKDLLTGHILYVSSLQEI